MENVVSRFLLLDHNVRHIYKEWARISLKNGVFPFFREFKSIIQHIVGRSTCSNENYVSERLDLVDYYFGDHPDADMVKMALIYRNYYVKSNPKSLYVLPISKIGSYIDHYGFKANTSFFKGVYDLIIGSNTLLLDNFNNIYDKLVETCVGETHAPAIQILLDILNFDLANDNYHDYERKVVVPLSNELSHLTQEEYIEKRCKYLLYLYNHRDRLFMTEQFTPMILAAHNNIEKEYNIITKMPEMYFRKRMKS